MNIFIILLIILLIICFLLVCYIAKYNSFQELFVKINEAEANIDTVLRKRFDLLNKSISIIKANTDVENEVLELIVKLRSRKLSNFELDRQLYDAINEFNYYKECYPSLMSNDTFNKIDSSLNDSEKEIKALRDYYNDTITLYNKKVKKFSGNVVANICKYKEKYYFDGKNMSDAITNDFKL